MMSRFKTLNTPAPRRLFLACLYALYFVLIVGFLIDNRNAFTSTDLGILVPSATLLGTAFVHGLGRAVRANFFPRKEPNKKSLVRHSTHNIVNNTLMLASSSGYLVYDALLLSRVMPLPVNAPYSAVAVRTAGMGIWNLSAGMLLFHALAHDRRQEDHPEEQVRTLGIHPATYTLSAELMLLAASVCVGYEFYSESPLNPFKCSAIVFWWVGSSLASIQAGYNFYHRNDVNAPVEMDVMPAVVVDDESSTEIVVEQPGSFAPHK